MPHESSHFVKCRPGGRLVGQIMRLFGVVAQMKQLLASVALADDIGPLCVFDCAQQRVAVAFPSNREGPESRLRRPRQELANG